MGNQDIVRRYGDAVARRDYASAEALRHPGWTSEWPQSGERVTSNEHMRAITERYPGGGWTSTPRRLTGAGDEVVLTPLGQLVTVSGSGDVWVAEWLTRYPDGSDWFVIAIVELLEGRVRRETLYWAPAYEAPAWRRPWVELVAAR